MQNTRAVSRYERDHQLTPVVGEGWKMETLKEPAPLFGSNGLRIGPDGRVYIAEWVGDRVSVYDPRDGSLSTAVSLGDPIDGPDDIAFDSAGNMYVTSFGTGKVQAKRTNGDFVTLVEEAPGANGITVDSDDRLFVSELRPAGRVMEVDRDEPESFRVLLEAHDHGNAFERGPDGNLYVEDVYAGTVSVIDAESGTEKVVVDGLVMPDALKFHPDGRLLVTVALEGVVAIDLDSGEREMVVERPGFNVDNLCLDGDDAVYITSFTEGQLERHVLGTGESEVLIEGGLVGPYGITRVGDRLLVADYTVIHTVEPDGSSEIWGQALEYGPSLDIVACDESRVLVLSRSGDVVRVTAGAMESEVLVEGTGSRECSEVRRSPGARAIAADADGFAVGFAGGDVVRMDAEGKELSRLSTGLGSVDALVVDGSRVVAAYEEGGSVIVIDGDERREFGGLADPAGVAALDGDVYVAERGTGEVRRFGAEGDQPEVVATGLPLAVPDRPRLDGRRSALLAWDGALVVGCPGDGSVRRLSRD